jgi:DNA-binding YbaB/EbfC family protein
MNLFKMLGSLGNLAKVQQEIQAVTDELARVHYEGKAGGGMVTVTVNGAQRMVSCAIDPKLVADDDRELIEDLIVAAVNEAMAEAKRKSAEVMQKKLGERLNLPDLSELLGSIMPKNQ